MLWLDWMSIWGAMLVVAIVYGVKAGHGEWAEYLFIPPLLYTDSLNHTLQPLIDQVRAGDPRALGRAISTVENRAPGWSDLLKALFPHSGHARILGLTGPPGAGKSTLVDQLARHYRKENRTVGIIAVDPTSP